MQLGLAESDLAGHFADDGVHLVVDADAPITRALGWLLRKPVVFVVLCGERTRGKMTWLYQLGQGCYYCKGDEGIKERKRTSDFKSMRWFVKTSRALLRTPSATLAEKFYEI